MKNNYLLFPLLCFVLILSNSCKTSQSILSTLGQGIHPSKMGGGSSGMEKIGDQSYLVVYDIKNFKPGTRMAMIKIGDEEMKVSPIKISGWGDEGRSSDLESICKIPGRANEYFIAESGNWKGDLGRIFHIQVDTTSRSATILGISKLPYKDINNPDLVGDQYESIACLPYSASERVLILAERGGSKVNPRGIVRWGIYNLNTHKLTISDMGMDGIPVDAPGGWTNVKDKRDITDLHIDSKGGIWAAASEDSGDAGPFYSVIYKLGELDNSNKERPFKIYSSFSKQEIVSGFKIEALSGPSKNIDCTHSFGTEDEMYGGVWRAVTIE